MAWWNKLVKPESATEIFEDVFETKITKSGFVEKLSKHGAVIAIFILLGLLYIANGYSMEKLERRENRLVSEVEELRTRSVSLNAEFMQMQRTSSIMEQVRRANLPLKLGGSLPIKLYR